MKFIPWNKDDWLSQQGNLSFFNYYDKLEHAYFWVPVVVITVLFIYWLFDKVGTTSLYVAVGTAVFLSFLKEFLDATTNIKGFSGGGWSWKDLLMDFHGIFSVSAILVIFNSHPVLSALSILLVLYFIVSNVVILTFFLKLHHRKSIERFLRDG